MIRTQKDGNYPDYSFIFHHVVVVVVVVVTHHDHIIYSVLARFPWRTPCWWDGVGGATWTVADGEGWSKKALKVL